MDGSTLKSLVKGAMKAGRRNGVSSSSGSVGCCNILRITDRDNGRDEFGALVEIQPAKLALHTMRTLDGTLVHGRRISVHRYRNRVTTQAFFSDTPPRDKAAGGSFPERRRNLRIDLAQRPVQRSAGVWSRLFSLQRSERDLGS
jgi:hypothetical protein